MRNTLFIFFLNEFNYFTGKNAVAICLKFVGYSKNSLELTKSVIYFIINENSFQDKKESLQSTLDHNKSTEF